MSITDWTSARVALRKEYAINRITRLFEQHPSIGDRRRLTEVLDISQGTISKLLNTDFSDITTGNPHYWNKNKFVDFAALFDEQADTLYNLIVNSLDARFDEFVANFKASGLRRARDEAYIWANSTIGIRLSSVDGLTISSSNVAAHAAEIAASGDRWRSLAILGPVGAGKTQLVADTVLALDKSLHPVVLGVDEVARWREVLAARLSPSRTVPLPSLDSLEQAILSRIVVVTDAIERATNLDEVVRHLRELSQQVMVVMTCRTPQWERVEATFGPDPRRKIIVRPLDVGSVAQALGKDHAFVRARPFLLDRGFADMAIHLAVERDRDADFPATETVLLDALRARAVAKGSGQTEAQASADARSHLLSDLAHAQFDQQRFDVDEASFVAQGKTPNARASRRRAIDALVSLRIAVKEADTKGNARLRLRHDAVDAHNIARVLLLNSSLVERSYEAIGTGFGTLVWQGLAQTAHDDGKNDVIRTFFNKFLYWCDHKDKHNARAWHSGFVVEARLTPVFLPLVREILPHFDSRLRPSGYDGVVSQLKENAAESRMTQNALSSVASRLAFVGTLSLADRVPEFEHSLLEQLEPIIRSAEWRKRPIEAIASIDAPDEGLTLLETVSRFCFDLSSPDYGALRSVATTAMRIGAESPSHHERATELAESVFHFVSTHNHPSAAVARRMIAPMLGRKLPDLTRDEITAGLSLQSPQNNAWASDWHDVDFFLRLFAEQHDALGAPLQQLGVGQIARLLQHRHSYTRQQAAATLGAIDSSAARTALVDAMRTSAESLKDAANLLAAILAALHEQARLLPDETARESFRTAIKSATDDNQAAAQRLLHALGER